MNDPLASQLLDCRRAATALLGCVLLRRHRLGMIRALIVETEAYPHDDPASHSFSGPSRRNASMFGPPGLAYVYRIHRCFCLNVVTGPAGRGEAVLVRAVEPIEGKDIMAKLRARATVGRNTPAGYALSNGPGKVCQALDLDLSFDGCSLEHGAALELEERRCEPKILCSARIGISKSRNRRLRFYIDGNRWVSPPLKRV